MKKTTKKGENPNLFDALASFVRRASK